MRDRLLRHWPFALTLLVLAPIAFLVTWSDQLADLGGDTGIYVMTARHFAPYLPADGLHETYAEASKFPPVFPLLLAATGAASDLRLAHAVTTACLLGGLAALYAYAIGFGLSRRLAWAVVVLFALLPETLARALQIRSEAPFLALSLLGFIFLGRASAGRATRDYWIATAVFALAMLTRTAGVALAAGLGIALLRERPRGWPWMVPAMLLPSALWSLQRPMQGYGEAVGDLLGTPLSSLPGMLLFNAQAFAWGLAGNVLQTQALLPVLVPLAAAAGLVFLGRFARGRPDAWYLAAYVAMMAAWPYPTEAQRFAWVVMPWLLVYAVWGASVVGARLAPGVAREVVSWLVPATLALVLAPTAHLAVQRWFEPAERALAHLPEWYLPASADGPAKARLHLDLTRAIAELGEQVPPGECLFSITPTVAFYANRPNYLVGRQDLGDAEFEAWTRQRGCRFFLLLSAMDGTITRETFYPRDRLGERLAVVDVRLGSDGSGRVIAALAVLRDRM